MMKESIGAILIGLAINVAAEAQTPANLPLLPPPPPLPSTVTPVLRAPIFSVVNAPTPVMPALPAPRPTESALQPLAELPSNINSAPPPSTATFIAPLTSPFVPPRVPMPAIVGNATADSRLEPLDPSHPDSLSGPSLMPGDGPLLNNLPGWRHLITDIDPDLLRPPVAAGGPTGAMAPRDYKELVWFNAEYLYWWIKSGPQPTPLLVTGSSSDQFPGVLNQPHTAVLFGGQNLNYDPSSGVRLSSGIWTSDHRFGAEISGFVIQLNKLGLTATGDALGNPFLARPIINAQTGIDGVYFVSQNFPQPNLAADMTGSIKITSTSQLWGWESNGLWNFYRGSSFQANLVGGFRSIGLNEQLEIQESLHNLNSNGALTFAGAAVNPSGSVNTYDRFGTQNTFYGPQLGARVHFDYDRFSLDFTGKAALGVSQEVVTITGGSALLNANGQTTASLPGGVLAQTSNIGRYFENRFSVVPEVNANLNYAVTDWMIVRAGYTFIYWNSVVRPGNQLDRTVNPNLVPTDPAYGAGGVARPAYTGVTSNFWTQGINLGIEFRY